MATALLVSLVLVGQADVPAGCGRPPSVASSSYWDYIEACGCAQTLPPSRASLDYDRYLKACAKWRRENPQVNVFVPSPSTSEYPAPHPSPTAPPPPTPRPPPRRASS